MDRTIVMPCEPLPSASVRPVFSLPPAPLPPWIALADRALVAVLDEVRLIHSVTAENAAEELERLVQAWAAGKEASPQWRHPAVKVRPELRGALDRLAETLEKEPPLGPIYAERARELALEAEMIAAVGSVRFRSLAAQRYVRQGTEREREMADALASAWATVAPDENEERLIASDDPDDPESLLSMLRAEIGRRQLPLRIVVQPGLASLAATADFAIVIAQGRKMRPSDAARTVLHEIEAHALPRMRASQERIGLFAIGTAGGLDDQEGRALVLERAAGFLRPSRLRELAFRHLAAAATLSGASFVEVVRLLVEKSAPLSTAVRIAARVQRGGGLAREIVYLPAFVRVGRALRATPIVEEMMSRGRIAADRAEQVAEALA